MLSSVMPSQFGLVFEPPGALGQSACELAGVTITGRHVSHMYQWSVCCPPVCVCARAHLSVCACMSGPPRSAVRTPPLGGGGGDGAQATQHLCGSVDSTRSTPRARLHCTYLMNSRSALCGICLPRVSAFLLRVLSPLSLL